MPRGQMHEYDEAYCKAIPASLRVLPGGEIDPLPIAGVRTLAVDPPNLTLTRGLDSRRSQERPQTVMKSKKPNKPLLFVIPAVLMLLTGFGILVRCSVGERLDAAHALMIPLGFATAAIGAMTLTRTLLATFFLFVYSIVALIVGIRLHGAANPFLIPFILLLVLCLPQAKYARR